MKSIIIMFWYYLLSSDECASNPCSHGSCTDEIAGYRCECVPGYKGDFCSLEIGQFTIQYRSVHNTISVSSQYNIGQCTIQYRSVHNTI